MKFSLRFLSSYIKIMSMIQCICSSSVAQSDDAPPHPVSGARIHPIPGVNDPIVDAFNMAMRDYLKDFYTIKLLDGSTLYSRNIMPKDYSRFSSYHSSIWRAYPQTQPALNGSEGWKHQGIVRFFDDEIGLEQHMVINVRGKLYIVNPMLRREHRPTSGRVAKPGFYPLSTYVTEVKKFGRNITSFDFISNLDIPTIPPLVKDVKNISRLPISLITGKTYDASPLVSGKVYTAAAWNNLHFLKDFLLLYEWKAFKKIDVIENLSSNIDPNTKLNAEAFFEATTKEFANKPKQFFFDRLAQNQEATKILRKIYDGCK